VCDRDRDNEYSEYGNKCNQECSKGVVYVMTVNGILPVLVSVFCPEAAIGCPAIVLICLVLGQESVHVHGQRMCGFVTGVCLADYTIG